MKKDEFCKKLKHARLDANLTQGDVAKILSVTPSAISLIESGERKIDVFELFELLKAYNKDISFLIDKSAQNYNKRWYDKEPVLSRAISLLERAPTELQKASAMGVIGFLQELHKAD